MLKIGKPPDNEWFAYFFREMFSKESLHLLANKHCALTDESACLVKLLIAIHNFKHCILAKTGDESLLDIAQEFEEKLGQYMRIAPSISETDGAPIVMESRI